MIIGLAKLVLKFLLTIIRLLLAIPIFIGKQLLKSPLYFLRFLHPISLTWFIIKTAVQLSLLLGVLAIAAYNYETISGLVCPNPPKSAAFPFESREWTSKPASGNTDIEPFSVAVPDEMLNDLKSRLENTRYGPPMDGVNFHYGFPASQLKNVVDYWKRSFNWRKQEEMLNRYPQFKTEIEGLNIHFAHVKPQADAKTKVLPIILLHGFPGSYFELYKLVPLLTASRSFKTNFTSEPKISVVFEVIIPSLPGFGFSDGAELPGLETGHIARIMHKLMTRLGHTGYVVHGGDWGSAVGRAMAVMYPKSVKGLELNMYPIPIGAAMAKGALGLATSGIFGLVESKFPGVLDAKLPALNLSSCLMDPADYGKIIWNNVKSMLKLTGYFHFHATRPDTVGAAVTDSPAGLAAYILDIFSWASSPENIEKADGGLKDSFSMDDLLTNIMICWINGNVMSGMRLYKEEFASPDAQRRMGYVVSVPTVLSDFPQEVAGGNPPAAFVKPYFKNLVDLRRHKSGGHFAGLENPEELSEDIWALVPYFATKPIPKDNPVKKEL